jgi:hypothetical protein
MLQMPVSTRSGSLPNFGIWEGKALTVKRLFRNSESTSCKSCLPSASIRPAAEASPSLSWKIVRVQKNSRGKWPMTAKNEVQSNSDPSGYFAFAG